MNADNIRAGDRVRIASCEHTRRHSVGVDPAMEDYIGEVLTVKSTTGELVDFESTRWTWVDADLEPVNNRVKVQYTLKACH